MRAIPFFRSTTPLTAAERVAKRRLVLQDTLALLTIFAITCVLALLTWLLFRSYSQHQHDAAARWKRRGEQALAAGNANAAVFDLRAALAYTPEDRATQIALAGALAQAGRLQEATAYFNTLRDVEPGSGPLNLQLARLAARQGQMASSLENYHASIYGTWEGDGAVRRRQVRLELVRYLIAQNRFGDARDELLIAAGNDTSTPALLEVAGLFEQAHAPADALRLYRQVLTQHPSNLVALEGAGQTAFTLGRYRTARTYLERALAAGGPAHPLVNRADVEAHLKQAQAVLAAYPSPQLPQRERLQRVIQAHDLARTRYYDCQRQLATAQPGGTAPVANAPASNAPAATGSAPPPTATTTTPPSSNPAPSSPAPVPSLAARLGLLAGNKPPQAPAPPPAAAKPDAPEADMASLAARWDMERPHLSFKDLEDNPLFEPAVMQLVYETEQVTSRACGEPAGDDAALLRIATSPDTVEQ